MDPFLTKIAVNAGQLGIARVYNRVEGTELERELTSCLDQGYRNAIAKLGLGDSLFDDALSSYRHNGDLVPILIEASLDRMAAPATGASDAVDRIVEKLNALGFDAASVSSEIRIEDFTSGWVDECCGEIEAKCQEHDSTLHELVSNKLARASVSGLDDVLRRLDPIYAAADVRSAIAASTDRVIENVKKRAVVVPRDRITHDIIAFANSDTAICVLEGGIRAGKTFALFGSVEALRGVGWAVLYVRPLGRSLGGVAAHVAEDCLGVSAPRNWRSLLIHPFREEPEETPGLVVMIDDVDGGGSAVLNLVTELADAMDHCDPEKLKVVIALGSDRSLLHDLQRALPQMEPRQWSDDPRDGGVWTVRVEDFTPDELDAALALIGADELKWHFAPGDTLDPYVVRMRGVLESPSLFGHFAALRSRRSGLTELSPCDLISLHEEEIMQEAVEGTGVSASALRGAIVGMLDDSLPGRPAGPTVARAQGGRTSGLDVSRESPRVTPLSRHVVHGQRRQP